MLSEQKYFVLLVHEDMDLFLLYGHTFLNLPGQGSGVVPHHLHGVHHILSCIVVLYTVFPEGAGVIIVLKEGLVTESA